MAAAVRILAVADRVDPALYSPAVREQRPDLVVACGDLPFEYLEYLVTLLNVPLVYVPGEGDPDLTPDPPDAGEGLRWEAPETRVKGPQGCINLDGRIEQVAGLTLAGLGGAVQRSEGPNQYTQAEMRWRALRLETAARLRLRSIDILVTHAPPPSWPTDAAGDGFAAFERLLRVLRPRLMLHGHATTPGERMIGDTRVVAPAPHGLIELDEV